jgi:hypothetical protein
LVNPSILQEVVFVEQLNPPGDAIAVYPVIAVPPSDPVAVQLTRDLAFSICPLTFVGALGAVAPLRLSVAIDGDELPLVFVATTTNLYAVPFVNPVTVQEVDVVVQVKRPGNEVTVYPVIALPPLDTGAVQLTTEEVLAYVRLTLVGGCGAYEVLAGCPH